MAPGGAANWGDRKTSAWERDSEGNPRALKTEFTGKGHHQAPVGSETQQPEPRSDPKTLAHSIRFYKPLKPKQPGLGADNYYIAFAKFLEIGATDSNRDSLQVCPP